MCGLIMCITLLQEDLITGWLSNKVVVEGCVKWQKALIIGNGLSSLGLTLVALLSLIIMNLWSKIGSAITESSNNSNGLRGHKNVRGVNESIHSKITNKTNTDTEEDLIIIAQDIEIYLKENIVKHGNSGKGKLLNFINNKIKVLWVNLKDTIIYLNKYLKVILGTVYDTLYSSLLQIYNVIYGGKIREEANALGNAKDTNKSNNRNIRKIS